MTRVVMRATHESGWGL